MKVCTSVSHARVCTSLCSPGHDLFGSLRVSHSELMWTWSRGDLASVLCQAWPLLPPVLRISWWWDRWARPSAGWDIAFGEACLCIYLLTCFGQHLPPIPQFFRLAQGDPGDRVISRECAKEQLVGLQSSGRTVHPDSNARAP